jgi:hypothetical protein
MRATRRAVEPELRIAHELQMKVGRCTVVLHCGEYSRRFGDVGRMINVISGWRGSPKTADVQRRADGLRRRIAQGAIIILEAGFAGRFRHADRRRDGWCTNIKIVTNYSPKPSCTSAVASTQTGISSGRTVADAKERNAQDADQQVRHSRAKPHPRSTLGARRGGTGGGGSAKATNQFM